jgi:acyl carrier protein
MDINEFIKNFAEQFENTNIESIAADTKFKELDEWSSLLALSIIAMVDDEYGIIIKGDDIRNSVTIGDLYNLVKSKI